MLPGIIRAIEPAFLRLDNRIDAIRIRSRNGDADPAQDSARKTIALEAFPRHAVVFGTVKSATRAAAREKPWVPPRLPKRCEHDVRIMRIENNVDPASVFIFRQDFRPCFAPVGRTKNSALLIWTESMTQRRDQNHILISWIDNQGADLPRVLEANVLPRFSAVDRFEDSGAVGGIAANGRFTGAGVNHIVVRLRNCNRADRRNRLLVKKWNPVRAAIGRFPDSARDRSEVIRVRLANDTFNCKCAPAAKRSDLSPTHPIKQFFIDCSRCRWGGG